VLDRLLGACLAVLAAAVAIYVAVRLIESVAATLLIIVAVIGSVVIAGFIARLLWRRHGSDRW
jgi:hypothetical protein